MNDETENNIINKQGEIEELEADIDYMWFYALYILEDTPSCSQPSEELQEQIKPLSDKIISLEAEIKELLKLL